jgi:hypothetical protein
LPETEHKRGIKEKLKLKQRECHPFFYESNRFQHPSLVKNKTEKKKQKTKQQNKQLLNKEKKRKKKERKQIKIQTI